MASAGRKIGIGVISVGVALAGVGVFAGGASAETGGDDSCAPALAITWGLDADPTNVDVDNLVAGGTVVVSDGTLTVTLSNAAPIAGHELSELTIGSLDFSTSTPVNAVDVRTWQAPGDYDHTTVDFAPPVNSGSVVSEDGSHPTLGAAPIKGLEFCYEVEVLPEETTTTQATTTTTEAAVIPQVEETTTTVPVEVLPQVETAPEIAFTGSETGPLVAIGGLLVAGGLALVGLDRVGAVRKGRHSR